jgi:hypothetical protein
MATSLSQLITFIFHIVLNDKRAMNSVFQGTVADTFDHAYLFLNCRINRRGRHLFKIIFFWHKYIIYLAFEHLTKGKNTIQVYSKIEANKWRTRFIKHHFFFFLCTFRCTLEDKVKLVDTERKSCCMQNQLRLKLFKH